MNIYKKLNNLLKTAESYQAEDLVTNAFIKIAQLPEGNYDQEVVSYVARLEQTILSQQLYLQYLTRENIQLKSMMPGTEANNTFNGVKFQMSGNYVNTPELLGNPSQPFIAKNENNQSTSLVEITPRGNIFNSGSNA
jgi:hypothetical protein